jgi:hypothetical protein
VRGLQLAQLRVALAQRARQALRAALRLLARGPLRRNWLHPHPHPAVHQMAAVFPRLEM